MGQLPPVDAVRIEEMINYFSYDYPEPGGQHPFSVYTELSVCPWNTDHQLLHVGLKGKSIDKEKLPASNLVFLLDVSGSMNGFRGFQIIFGLLLMVPVVYTLWSIHKYFGIPRALGGDHFRQQYREMPLVRKGAFKYSANAMYTFVFLIFWAIAFLTGSFAALAAALFQHAYIWVHLYCTEEPDMRVIYGNKLEHKI